MRLIAQARSLLREAELAESDERFRLSHLAALRATAALLADRADPTAPRRPISAWILLRRVAPELSDWADLFAAAAPRRAAVEAGARHVVSTRDADDQCRAADQFLTAVERAVGLLGQALAS